MAATNINRVVLTGNLTRDPELRNTPSGTPVCSLRIACNTRRKDSSGEWVDKPNYFDVTVWGAQGENCATYLSKGRPVAVDGRLELNGVSDDIDGLPLRSFLRLPLAPLQAPVHGHRTALGEVGGAVLALRAPDRDVEVVRLVDPLARAVLAARVARDPQRADAGAARGAPQLGIPGEVPGEHDAVDVGCCHTALLQSVLDSLPRVHAGSEAKRRLRREVAGMSENFRDSVPEAP